MEGHCKKPYAARLRITIPISKKFNNSKYCSSVAGLQRSLLKYFIILFFQHIGSCFQTSKSCVLFIEKFLGPPEHPPRSTLNRLERHVKSYQYDISKIYLRKKKKIFYMVIHQLYFTICSTEKLALPLVAQSGQICLQLDGDALPIRVVFHVRSSQAASLSGVPLPMRKKIYFLRIQNF